MSLLVMTIRSATAACFAASGISSRFCRPFTASTSVTTQSRRYCAPSMPSVCSVCSTGTGSASPVVSTKTRSKSITSPARRLMKSSRSVSCRSVRTVQHRQPLERSVMLSEDEATSSWSMPTSPNSLMMTAAEERSDDDVFGLPGAGHGQVLVQVVRAEASAVLGEGLDRRHRKGTDRHGIALDACVHHPDELGPVLPVGMDALVAHDQELAPEKRQHRMGEPGVRRRIAPVRDKLRSRFVGDVEDHRAARNVADVGAVGPLGKYVGVVRAIARVE